MTGRRRRASARGVARGGRNRKKKATAATNGDGDVMDADGAVVDADGGQGVDVEEQAVDRPVTRETVPPGDHDADEGYVPMSEWIEDFDRRS